MISALRLKPVKEKKNATVAVFSLALNTGKQF